MTGLFDVDPLSLCYLVHGRMFVKGRRFANLDGQRASWADPDAEASAIAKLLLNHSRLAIDQFDGAFGAGDHACPAAVAQILFDTHDLACDHSVS
jgi:hypothetical protein